MKKRILISAVSLVFVMMLVGIGFYFYSKYLKGINVALKNPDKKVVEMLDNNMEFIHDSAKVPAKNIMDFPLSIPDGFSFSIYAKNLDKPRVLARDCFGNMVVSEIGSGKVLALVDEHNDGYADKNIVVREGLKNPHGLAFRMSEDGMCQVYIAEEDKVALYDYDKEAFAANFNKKIIDLPEGSGHFTRTLLLAKINGTEKLLISVGSSCNVCNESDEMRAAITVVNLDGTDPQVYAKGLRNSVFMIDHPVTGEIYATEMGRDWLGDDLPPDEINIIKQDGNYGWPTCFGKNIHDNEFDKNVYIRNPCMEPFEKESYINVPAHSAPLGLDFFKNDVWGNEYIGDLLVAYHGSWNRSIPMGYKIVKYDIDMNGGIIGVEDFVSGFLGPNQEKYGRPVDIMIEPGVIYFSDDALGVIYSLKLINEIDDCFSTGCSGELCSDKELVTTCEYREEYNCYNNAICERNDIGECSWRKTMALQECLINAKR